MISVLVIEDDQVLMARLRRLLSALEHVQLKLGICAKDILAEQAWAHVIVLGKLPEAGMQISDVLLRVDTDVFIITTHPDPALDNRRHEYVSRTSAHFDEDFLEAFRKAWDYWVKLVPSVQM